MNTVCANPGDFNKYFTENMHALGLFVPATWFDTYSKAVETAAKMSAALHTLGSGATLAEIAGATFFVEKLFVAAAMDGSYYLGAVIGSIVVAYGRIRGCGASLADVFAFIRENKLPLDDWEDFFARNPQIFYLGHPNRESFGAAAYASQFPIKRVRS